MKRIFDSFMFRDELDMLEMRLYELQDVPNLFHVIVEADRTHGHNRAREYVYPDHKDRFSQWADRIIYVQASGLPNDVDAWSREHAQREFVWRGLARAEAEPQEVVLHGDLDEIPSPLFAQWVNPARGFVRAKQRLVCFAVDWLHPEPWWGTVAGRVGQVTGFANMRDARCSFLPEVEDAGTHCSWLGSLADNERKMRSFCHPEVETMGWYTRLQECYETGLHVDGKKLAPVDVDESWPRWIVDGHAPENWYRPR